MFENFKELDAAIDWILEKATDNPRVHMASHNLTQEDYDQHVDALAHHTGAIEHYRNKPSVQGVLSNLQKLVPVREYVNKAIKLENAKPPHVEVSDLKLDHPLLQGRDDHQKIVDSINQHLTMAHKIVTEHPDMIALRGHSERALAHLSRMVTHHRDAMKGLGTHHQFAGKIEGPELQGNFSDSEYRHHSTPNANDPTRFRTQSLDKLDWHFGIPELGALAEVSGHPSSGKMKKEYPFREIKVNHVPLAPKEFEKEPELVHDMDYNTDLSREHQVRYPNPINPHERDDKGRRIHKSHHIDAKDARLGTAIGKHSGLKGMAGVLDRANRTGIMKKSEGEESCYFPEVSMTRLVLAKNLLPVFNPFSGMDDVVFANLVNDIIEKSSDTSTQAAILAESYDRLQKADRSKKDAKQSARWQESRKIPEREWHQGVADVLSGKIVPVPTTTAATRSKKEGEKLDELQEIIRDMGYRKRSPFAVPDHVFTDDSHTKVDPQKYKEWMNGEPTEQDVRNEHATYSEIIRDNPAARQRHNAFVQSYRDLPKASILSSPVEDDGGKAPSVSHQETVRDAARRHAAGEIDAKEYAQIVKESSKAKADAVAGKVARAKLTDEQRAIQDVDPSYSPRRLGQAGEDAEASMSDLTSVAHGKIPSHMLADKDMFSAQGDDQELHAREMLSSKTSRSEGESQSSASGSEEGNVSPIDLIRSHPGFSAYLRMRQHALSHYKDPAVKQYMENKLLQHENDPKMDPAKLAGMYHVLHRSRERAIKAAGGLDKLHAELKASGAQVLSEGTTPQTEDPGKGRATIPESMMTPDQVSRMNQIRQQKSTEEMTKPIPQAAPVGAVKPATGEGKTADPEYKKKLMAELQARENEAKKPKQ